MVHFRGAPLFAVILAGSAAWSATPASAQGLILNTERQWYVQGFAGVNFAHGVAVTDSIPPDLPYDLTFDPGFAIGGAVGVAFSSGLRLEAEASYRANGPNEVCFLGACADPAGLVGGGADGELSALTLMVNALYDFDTGSPVTPYLGAGLGAGNVDYQVAFGGASYGADSWGVALQVIAGLSYQLSPQLALFADYRFLTVLDSGVEAPYPPGGYTVAVDDDYRAHSFLVGLRYLFGSASAPAASAIATPAGEPVAIALAEPEAPLQRHVVIFEAYSADLDSRARGVIAEVARHFQDSGFVRLFAQGAATAFSDTGSDLALRRAHAVRRDLIDRGVPAGGIIVRVFGSEEVLLAPSGGVPEAGAPRVEVILI
ncbi:MAG: outer membrane beta-barrel protein [Azospirillaceae bacterium]